MMKKKYILNRIDTTQEITITFVRHLHQQTVHGMITNISDKTLELRYLTFSTGLFDRIQIPIHKIKRIVQKHKVIEADEGVI